MGSCLTPIHPSSFPQTSLASLLPVSSLVVVPLVASPVSPVSHCPLYCPCALPYLTLLSLSLLPLAQWMQQAFTGIYHTRILPVVHLLSYLWPVCVHGLEMAVLVALLRVASEGDFKEGCSISTTLQHIPGKLHDEQCWGEVLGVLVESWGCSAWTREGSEETLVHLPVLRGVTGKLDQGMRGSGKGKWL